MICLMPHGAMADADALELSQDQLRHLVAQDHVLSSETVIMQAASRFDGAVMDIRGFLADGQMTYRLLIKQTDGSVAELLINGVTGEHVAHTSQMGQSISAGARSTFGVTVALSSKSFAPVSINK